VRLLEDWAMRRYHDAVGTPAETKRFTVVVRGPLPGNALERGVHDDGQADR
jgi:hypothetical protein